MRIKHYLIYFLVIVLTFSTVIAESVTKFPTASVNDNSIGTTAWTSLGNILTDNSQYSEVDLSTSTQSQYIKVSNFGFSIPTDATINGVEVNVERVAEGPNSINDTSARLVLSNGSISTTDKSNLNFWDTSTEVVIYGSNTDLWGEIITPTDINDVDFGFALSATNHNTIFGILTELDYISMTIYYTEASDTIINFCSIREGYFSMKEGVFTLG